MVFEMIHQDNFEQLVYCHDSRVGLRAIISLHSTVLGPATGGCRMWNYATEAEALNDVLRLSKGMTYKAAISGLKWGGGKAVIIGDPKAGKTPAMLARFGEFVDRLGGRYITAKDVGIGAEDLRHVKSRTGHVLGIDGESGSSGDPSPATAWGVYHGMLACVKQAYGANSLRGIKVALQGLGSVSYYLLSHLAAEGATVIGCDVDPAAIKRAVDKYGIEIVSPDRIYDMECDIFSPAALGATINAKTLPRIRAKVVAGPANNQLERAEDGVELEKRGMTYAPDYVINAGGLINIYHERGPSGYNRDRAFAHVAKIEQTVAQILERSRVERMPSGLVADRIVEESLARSGSSDVGA